MRSCIICNKVKPFRLFFVNNNICKCCSNKKKCMYCNTLLHKDKFRYARNRCIPCEYTERRIKKEQKYGKIKKFKKPNIKKFLKKMENKKEDTKKNNINKELELKISFIISF